MGEGKAHKHMAGIAHDAHIAGLKQITKLVHEAGTGSLIAAQLNHGGAHSVSTNRKDKETRVMSEVKASLKK